jgi:hypothetical protein
MRSMDGKRGLLGAAVALVLLLSGAILGVQLATEAHTPAPSTGPAPAHAAAPAPAPSAPAPGVPAPPNTAPLAQLPPAVTQLLKQHGFTAAVWAGSNLADCVGNSYGQTQAFLRSSPCVGVRRALLDVRGPGPGEALVAVSWVHMRSAWAAAALKVVLDRSDSGNINSLNPTVPFTGQYYASRVDGSTVVNADAHPLVPGMSPQALKTIATDAIG